MKKLRLKKRISFSFFKNHKAISIILLLIGVGAFIAFGVRFAKYTYDAVYTYYLRTQNFYFNSNRLTMSGKTYSINPWPGTPNIGSTDNSQGITIEMNSKDNDLKMASVDIQYKVTVSCSNAKVTCYVQGSTGTADEGRPLNLTIPESTNTDSFKVVVEANPSSPGATTSNLKDGDTVEVQVVAEAYSPYKLTLRAKFVITVGNYGVNYSIKNSASYIDTLITNSLPNDVYVGLEITNMSKISFDMSNVIYNGSCQLNTAIVGTPDCIYKVTSDGSGHNYISAIYFKVDTKSSMLTRFYKLNYEDPVSGALIEARSVDYTYPNGVIGYEPIVRYCVVPALNRDVHCTV